MWRAALLRRAAERETAHELFALPDAALRGNRAADSRGWHCGALLSWADVNVSCEEALGDDLIAGGKLTFPDSGGVGSTISSNASLLPLPGGGCHLDMKMIILWDNNNINTEYT